jgi:exosortase family protein XrtM
MTRTLAGGRLAARALLEAEQRRLQKSSTFHPSPNRHGRPAIVAALMDGRKEIQRRRIRFAITFAVCAGVLLTLYSFPYAQHGVREDWFARYLSAYAHVTGAFLHLFDPTVHVIGREIVGRTSLTVAKNCDAMDVNLLLVAAMIAFPAPWKRRLVGIVAGVGLLSIVNLLRIVTLYQINIHAPRAFELVHAEVFPLVMVVLAVGAFGVWSRWSRQGERAPVEVPPNAEV